MVKPLKILQITNRIPYPLNDGGNIATYNVTKYLHLHGHRVILASLNTNKHFQESSVLANIAEVYTTKLDTTISILGVIKSVFQKFPYNIKRFISTEFEVLLEKLIKENEPDIIQMEGIYLAVYAKKIKSITNAPLILRSHNIEHEIWKRAAQNEKNSLKKWYLEMLYHKIKTFELEHISVFNGIIAITEKDATFYIQNNYKGKLKTVPAGTDIEPSTLPMKSTNPSICFLGSMEWLPNIQGIEWYLKNVWPSLRKKSPSLTLHIAGKNMSEEMKARKIDGVTFHGMVPDSSSFIAQHTFMIVPLLSGGGMRLKIIEAMALARCIISTRIGAEGIKAEEGHEIILADTPEQFIWATELILNDLDKAKRIGQNAQKLALKEYSWEKLVQEIEKFYIELQ